MNTQPTTTTEHATAALVHQPAIDEPHVQLVQLGRGADYWIEHFEPALKFCERMLTSGFLGQHIKKAEQALMIMMAGDELGLPPTVAFRDLYVVHGRIGMYADLMVALVHRSGRAKYVRQIEATPDRAVYETWRRGEDRPRTYEFTMERAAKAGYPAQNPKYGTDPIGMLSARCKGILCKDVYGDVIRGFQTREELEDEGAEAPRDVTPPSSSSRPIADAEIKPARAAAKPGEVEAPWRAQLSAAADEKALDEVRLAMVGHFGQRKTPVPLQEAFKARLEEIKAAPAAASSPTATATTAPNSEPPKEPAAPDPRLADFTAKIAACTDVATHEALWQQLNDSFAGDVPADLVQLHEARGEELGVRQPGGEG